MVQHMMVRQRILLSGRFKEKRERNANMGYVLDFDTSPLTPEDRKLAEVNLSDSDMNVLVEFAFQEATLICTQTHEKPVPLAPLGAPMRTGKKQPTHDRSPISIPTMTKTILKCRNLSRVTVNLDPLH
jgi:hypothetical protein